MRCDLHVHSRHSGLLELPVFGPASRECYSDPLAVHAVARSRGMDLVTLTDHDSIEGALELVRRFDDAFVSEEVTCIVPGGREVHIGVFDLDEAQHGHIARLRNDAEALFAYLAEQRLPACVNHPFSGLTGARETADLRSAFRGVALVEARNGLLPTGVNECGAAAARALRRPTIGGSDAHTLRSVARAFTEVRGASDKGEFLAGLRRGWTVPRGATGSYLRLAGDIACLFGNGCIETARARPAWLPLVLLWAPLLPLLPLATAAIALRDVAFARRHFGALLAEPVRPRLRPPGAGSLQPEPVR
jgi:predicted metal-dependent phosphoesterase TrpH